MLSHPLATGSDGHHRALRGDVRGARDSLAYGLRSRDRPAVPPLGSIWHLIPGEAGLPAGARAGRQRDRGLPDCLTRHCLTHPPLFDTCYKPTCQATRRVQTGGAHFPGQQREGSPKLGSWVAGPARQYSTKGLQGSKGAAKSGTKGWDGKTLTLILLPHTTCQAGGDPSALFAGRRWWTREEVRRRTNRGKGGHRLAACGRKKGSAWRGGWWKGGGGVSSREHLHPPPPPHKPPRPTNKISMTLKSHTLHEQHISGVELTNANRERAATDQEKGGVDRGRKGRQGGRRDEASRTRGRARGEDNGRHARSL